MKERRREDGKRKRERDIANNVPIDKENKIGENEKFEKKGKILISRNANVKENSWKWENFSFK